MSTMTTGASAYRLEGYRSSRGLWRWRARTPEGVIDMSSTFLTRDEAMEDGRAYLSSQGVPEGSWDEWADGVSEHLMEVPRLDFVSEAKRLASKDPEADRVAATHRELEARRDAATEAVRLSKERPGAEMTQDADPAPATPTDTPEEVVARAQEGVRSPIGKQRAKTKQIVGD